MGNVSDCCGAVMLDLCGGTGSWSRPFSENGCKVINVTLPACDVRNFSPPDNVCGILAAPPCPEFSFARTNAKKPRDLHKGMEIALACLKIIWECQYRIESDVQKYPPLRFWALENPKGMLNWFLGEPAFEFNPYDFGDNYKKRSCLWGDFRKPRKQLSFFTAPKFDRLKTREIHGEFYGELSRTDRRAITPSGFAEAFFIANKCYKTHYYNYSHLKN